MTSATAPKLLLDSGQTFTNWSKLAFDLEQHSPHRSLVIDIRLFDLSSIAHSRNLFVRKLLMHSADQNRLEQIDRLVYLLVEVLGWIPQLSLCPRCLVPDASRSVPGELVPKARQLVRSMLTEAVAQGVVLPGSADVHRHAVVVEHIDTAQTFTLRCSLFFLPTTPIRDPALFLPRLPQST